MAGPGCTHVDAGERDNLTKQVEMTQIFQSQGSSSGFHILGPYLGRDIHTAKLSIFGNESQQLPFSSVRFVTQPQR